MDIKKLSPQNLFVRFATTFTVCTAFSLSGIELMMDIKQCFLFSLTQVIIFSILMMFFYIVMVQYLIKKDKLQLFEALLYRFGGWPVSFVSTITACLLFQINIQWLLLLCFWLSAELSVYLVQWLFKPRRRKDDGR